MKKGMTENVKGQMQRFNLNILDLTEVKWKRFQWRWNKNHLLREQRNHREAALIADKEIAKRFASEINQIIR